MKVIFALKTRDVNIKCHPSGDGTITIRFNDIHVVFYLDANIQIPIFIIQILVSCINDMFIVARNNCFVNQCISSREY